MSFGCLTLGLGFGRPEPSDAITFDSTSITFDDDTPTFDEAA